MTANVTFGAESISANPTIPTVSPLPAYSPRFNRVKPVIAVVAENHFTELTDYVIPYGVLSESGVAQVFAIATEQGPIRTFPALQVEAQTTLAEFDAQFSEGADYVVVPAVARNKDPELLKWINGQAQKGATMVGVCDGAWVLAHAGLLDGHKAVGHWFSFKHLEKKFPKTEWIRNTRYIADGNVITTTGVTAAIPVCVALVEAIAGQAQAASLAQRLGISNWDAAHQSQDFQLKVNDIFTAIANGLSFWTHEEIGIPIDSGVDEIALSLIADAYSRTLRSKAFSLSASKQPVITKHGLVILPDRIEGKGKAVNRTLKLRNTDPPVSSFNATLEEIEQQYGSNTAAFIALQLEYPRRGLGHAK
ncbi:MAG: transcriptional regulator, partial [Leptolyngbya sp. SIO1D8]|nr:transcriptional regulator [Leptolyngbya sp. SIO1D8]